MPKISRYFIKSGMVYLLFGVLVYGLAEFPGTKWDVHLMPVYWHMIALGWITQIIMGVSLWMFPKGKNPSPKEGSSFAWIAYFALNLGLCLRIVSEPFLYGNKEVFILPFLCSVFLQLVGILSFVFEIWPRLKPKPQG
ncbi:hypothetical protein [Leptospira perdikensis]|uniref:Cytochrome C and Quinol oxidase polypeptide I n=1 Tax=Leptospira perdikensis TaxID=2484948 RepID=A0A4R9JK09_9LEPT|nr:hypothetical protein [Leptospira perdikensis]TGL44598.1 hypothetical protein EHQ49_03750 [Leptospira perdikensis]